MYINLSMYKPQQINYGREHCYFTLLKIIQNFCVPTREGIMSKSTLLGCRNFSGNTHKYAVVV